MTEDCSWINSSIGRHNFCAQHRTSIFIFHFSPPGVASVFMFQWIHFTRCRSWLTAIVVASASLPWGNLLLCLFLVALIRSAPRCVRRATGQLLSSLIFYSSQRICLRALLQRRICGLNYFELQSFCIAPTAFFSTSINSNFYLELPLFWFDSVKSNTIEVVVFVVCFLLDTCWRHQLTSSVTPDFVLTFTTSSARTSYLGAFFLASH